MGVIYSAFILSYGILMIPGGRLADRFGPRRVLTVMGLGAAVFTATHRARRSPSVWHLARSVSVVLGDSPRARCSYGSAVSLVRHRELALDADVLSAPVYGDGSPPGPASAVRSHRFFFTWMIDQYGWRTSFVLSGPVTGILGVHLVLLRPRFSGECSSTRYKRTPNHTYARGALCSRIVL